MDHTVISEWYSCLTATRSSHQQMCWPLVVPCFFLVQRQDALPLILQGKKRDFVVWSFEITTFIFSHSIYCLLKSLFAHIRSPLKR